MRTIPIGIYATSDVIPTDWPNNVWLIDANTPGLLPLLTTDVSNLKPTIVTTELKSEAAIEAADKSVSSEVALVIMNPYEAEAIIRFTATMYLNGLSSKGDTLIDTAASLNLVSKEFGMINGFYEDC